MTELGFKLSADDIYNLNKPSIKDAVVIFGGGCTGEIVSSQGLLLTNHHCGYGQIQSHSSVEHDYLKNGYWAMNKEEELPNPGLSVTFLRSIEDVTNRVLENVSSDMNETERLRTVNGARQEIEKKASEGNDYRVTVASFYGGNYFYLMKYERFSDVRYVGSPPSSIGKFGFDTDNWEWPRHTGDFSVFRVYMSPEGKPAIYSGENIPLKPKYVLPVSIGGIDRGDFAMVIGYPGKTDRYMTSWEIGEELKITHPNRIRIRGIRQDILMADMKADEKVNIQYASKYSTSSNYWKYSIGQKEGLERLNVIAEKQKLEEQFRTWMDADPERKSKYGEALDLIRSAIEGRAALNSAQQYLQECFERGSELLGFSNEAGRLILLLRKMDREQATEDLKAIRTMLDGDYKDYNPPTDRKVMKAMLKLYREDVPPEFHPDFYATIVDKKFKGDIDRFVDYLFDVSIFADEARYDEFLEKPNFKIIENDPAYLTSLSIARKESEIARNLGKFDISLNRGRRLWIAALMEMAPEKTLYPDANSTMRLSYGSVLGYVPRDAVSYNYYTTLEGVMEKYKPGDYEFDVPKRLIDLYKNREFGRYATPEGKMPVCFTTNNDITGGNSGSPVMNSRGELIGLAFDGNWEAMSGDIAYEPALQRTIAVDIRYVLWIMDIYAGAGHLVEEMNIVR
jgi:V8-like Glu-specific endopeptidase